MTHPLLKSGASVNLCFHDIADDRSVIYTVSNVRLRAVADGVRQLGIAPRVRFYFDDGYLSVLDAVGLLRRDYPEIQVVLALTIAFLDTPGFISWRDVERLHLQGAAISGHGREHLHMEQLDQAEILAQLRACDQAFGRYGSDEFVLPYGTYDERVLAVNRRARLFAHLTTVEYGWDRGQQLRPRLVVTSELSTADVCARLAAPV